MAEDLAERFPDGVRFIELESARSQHDLFVQLMRQLDIVLQPGKGEEQCVLDFLAEKKLLFVLDNAEQIIELPATLDRLISGAPRAKFLVSSRERLQISSAHTFEVARRSTPPQVIGGIESRSPDALLEYESVQFFTARARQHLHSFELTEENATDIARLCRQLEGVPLALELAAAWVADLSPSEILEELEQQWDVLSIEATDIPERQRAMRSSIDCSFMRLSPEEQRILVLLSISSGGVTRHQCGVARFTSHSQRCHCAAAWNTTRGGCTPRRLSRSHRSHQRQSARSHGQ